MVNIKNSYKIIIGIVYIFSALILTIELTSIPSISYLMPSLFFILIISPLIVWAIYKKIVAGHNSTSVDDSKKFSNGKFITIMIIGSLLIAVPINYFLIEVKFQIESTDSEKRSREINDKLKHDRELEQKLVRYERIRSEEIRIKNSDITFPITNNVYKTLSKEELRDKIYSNLVKYKGEDGVGDTLYQVLADVLKRSCSISEKDMERVSGNFDYKYKYEIKEEDNTKYAVIVFFIKFKASNDEFGNFTDEGLCVALTNFKFITNLQTGEISRVYGDKNAKIVQDILK